MVDILALQKQLSDLEAENTRLSEENDRLTGHLALCIEGMKDKNKRILELEAIVNDNQTQSFGR
jgi:regulator of replication initiation timing